MHRAALVALACVVAGAPAAGAQTCSVNGAAGNCAIQPVTVQMTTTKVVRLSVSPTTVTLTSPSAADYDAGFAASTGPTITVDANTPWTVSARAGAALWTATNTVPGVAARANKPASELEWSVASNGSFAGFTTTNVTIASGNRVTAAVSTLYYRTRYSWTADTPGDYSLPVVITIVAP